MKTMGESNLRAITVEYFAILREQRGVARETLTTAAGTPTALYAELHGRHGFSLPADGVRAAVNGVVVNGDAPLRDGDLVVFIPPVAGG